LCGCYGKLLFIVVVVGLGFVEEGFEAVVGRKLKAWGVGFLDLGGVVSIRFYSGELSGWCL